MTKTPEVTSEFGVQAMNHASPSAVLLPAPCVQNHAANLWPLAGGDLLCTWFAGSQEGVPDISVYCSRLVAGSKVWTPPVKLSHDPDRSEQNPTLFMTPTGQLWLMWTAQVSGNQDTAFVRRRISLDGGITWGPIETLFEPRQGVGTFIRQPPIVLRNGDWLLPVFECHRPGRAKWTGNYDSSTVKISQDGGRNWKDYPVPESTGCVHMNIEQLGDGSLVAVFRSRWADFIYSSRSLDNGRTWSAPKPTELRNNNSSIQLIQLLNGHLALVFNDANASQTQERRVSLYDEIVDESDNSAPEEAEPVKGRQAVWGVPRAPLNIAISEDGGRTWPWCRIIEEGDGYCMTNNSKDKRNRELSYPSIKQSADGAIHVAYTHFRQHIKYVCLTESWVKGEGAPVE